MNRQWYSASELAALQLPHLPKSKRAINYKAARESWKRRANHGRKGGGYEYHLSSLPDAAREELAAVYADGEDIGNRQRVGAHEKEILAVIKKIDKNLRDLRRRIQQ